MENKVFTEIISVLDRSGSMASIKRDAIGGFNSFVETQKEFGDNVFLTTVLFDDRYEVIHDNISINKIELLNEYNFVPRGTTALYDAIGKAINTVRDRHLKTNSPEKIICVILTDGQENASREYNDVTISALIKEMTDKYNWEFVFLAANQNAFSKASSLNIPVGNTLNFQATSDGVFNLYSDVSNSMTSYRSVSESYKKGTFFSSTTSDKTDGN
jgi:uncharacterized protein YegL